MQRRAFTAGMAAAAWPAVTRAQSNGVRVVGMLMGFESGRASQGLVAEFRKALARQGWNEGGNLRIELRWGNGNLEQIGEFARELVDLQPNVILAQTTPVTRALAKLTRTIPIVFVVVSDPIGSGFATSLAHPNGNLTGFTFVEPEMGGKWIELLKEIAPGTERIALMFNPETAPPLKFYLASIESAARTFAIKIRIAEVRHSSEIDSVFVERAGGPGGGMLVMPDAFNAANRDLIIALAARYKVPAIYGNDFTQSGGLIFYGPDFADTFRSGAGYVHRVLRGEKPADLPIQLPSKFDLSLNLKTARALGLEVPMEMQQRANLVIQ
jgi:putative ABC transport system substrate-binding protein